MDDDLLLLPEVAAMCRATIPSVREWIRTGRLKASRPGRRVLIRRSDVEAMLAAASMRSPNASRTGGVKRKHTP